MRRRGVPNAAAALGCGRRIGVSSRRGGVPNAAAALGCRRWGPGASGIKVRCRNVQTVLFVLAAGNAAVLAWDLITGGIYFKVFGWVVSSSDIRRPFWAASVCGALALWLSDRSALTPTWNVIPRWSRSIAAGAAVASTVIAFHFGVFVAGDSDQYGYVSQAQLWTTGRLVVPDQLATLAPLLGPAVAPLGYRLALTPAAIVPTYPPGLPLVMALAEKTAGPHAVYYVVPLLAGLAVWLTYVLAERSFDRRTALVACVVFASSPLFLFLTFEPMSDAPATAWWLIAWVLATQAGTWTAFGAGFASGAAILTRPNIVVLTTVLALVVAESRPRLRRVLLFAAPVVTACLLIALINRALYGSPFESGHGSLGYLFQTERIPQNLQRYLGWLVELHTPVILLAYVAPFVSRRSQDSSFGAARPLCWAMLLFSGVLLSCYLPYFVFDNWTFLRFLLPAIPLLFILASLVIVRAIEWLPVSCRTVCLIAICVAGCLWYGFKAASLGLFGPERAEDRYKVVGEYVGRALPSNAVVLTDIQSGSIRWYGHRTTLRWTLVEDGRLDEAIDVLAAHGYEPYILLEDHEESSFREHFARANIFGRIDWAPAIEYLALGHVRVYAIADRQRHLAGERILTHPILAPD
jgi:hypothetical protein